jgi:hypothetical protein
MRVLIRHGGDFFLLDVTAAHDPCLRIFDERAGDKPDMGFLVRKNQDDPAASAD